MKVVAAGLLVLAAAVYVVCRGVGHGHGRCGLRTGRRRGVDGRRAGRLVRGDRAVPPSARACRSRTPRSSRARRTRSATAWPASSGVLPHRRRSSASGLPRPGCRSGSVSGSPTPTHARQVADELSNAVGGIASVLRDDELRNAVATFADKRLRELDAVAAARADARRGVRCRPAPGDPRLPACAGCMRFLDENQSVLRRRLDQESPEWVPEWVDDRVFAEGLQRRAVLPGRRVGRRPSTSCGGPTTPGCAIWPRRLRTDPEQAARVERAKLRAARPPGRSRLAVDALAADEEDGASTARRTRTPTCGARSTALTVAAGASLRDDRPWLGEVDEALQRLAGHVVTQYGPNWPA